MGKIHILAAAGLLAMLSSCVSLHETRCLDADLIAYDARLKKTEVKTDPFVLTAYSRIDKKGEPVHIYIEGDGYAWDTSTRVSSDPTPRHSVTLELAALDPAPNVIYLARPCQYTPEECNPACEPYYWTNGRFSEPVVKSVDQAVAYFVKEAGAPGVHFTGYSGGAAVAVLVAARRKDVLSLRTVAGNLDPEAVNKAHDVSPLEGSLNPMDFTENVKNIPMRHFTGTLDQTVPASVARSFAERCGDLSARSVTEINRVTHSDGWEEHWPELLREPFYPEEKN